MKEACLDIFNAGRFQAAVFEAFLLVEIAVREHAAYTADDYGTDMIARAFNADSGPLSDENQPDAQRKAMQRLMTGAHGVFKNPRRFAITPMLRPPSFAFAQIISGAWCGWNSR